MISIPSRQLRGYVREVVEGVHHPLVDLDVYNADSGG